MTTKQRLKTERNTPEAEEEIRDAFGAYGPGPCNDTFFSDYEHGQWWITCRECGAQWSVCDSNQPGGFSFEEVSPGDETHAEQDEEY